MTFRKLMYLIKGVIMFAIFNIDVADKNPKYKEQDPDQDANDGHKGNQREDDEPAGKGPGSEEQDPNGNSEGPDVNDKDDTDGKKKTDGQDEGTYRPEPAYSPSPNIKRHLLFSESEGKIINSLKGTDNLGDKIYGLVFELHEIETDTHRYAVACLYRSLIESATKKFVSKHSQVSLDSGNLETSIVNVLNYFGNKIGTEPKLSDKLIKQIRTTVTKNKIIDILNEYVHNETIPDAFKIQESWNTMKEYIILCLSL